MALHRVMREYDFLVKGQNNSPAGVYGSSTDHQRSHEPV